VGSVGEFPGSHASKEVKIFIDGTVARGAVLSRLSQGAAIGTHLFGRQRVDVREAFPDQLYGKLVESFEVIRGKEHLLVPVEPQPSDVVLNGLYIFRIFGGRIGIVKSQVADAAWGVVCQAEVQADRFRVADMEIAVRLRWKARHDSAAMFASGEISGYYPADKV